MGDRQLSTQPYCKLFRQQVLIETLQNLSNLELQTMVS